MARFLALCLCLLLGGLAVTSCRQSCVDPESAVHSFTVPVDSVLIAPADPCEGDTLTLRFFGLMGDCCSERFTHFETYRDSFQLDVTVWADRPLIVPCCFMDTYLEGEPLDVYPVYQGELLVIVHQPEGPALITVVEVSDCSDQAVRPNIL